MHQFFGLSKYHRGQVELPPLQPAGGHIFRRTPGNASCSVFQAEANGFAADLSFTLRHRSANIDEGFVVAGAINNIGFQLGIDQRIHRLSAGAAGKPGAFG